MLKIFSRLKSVYFTRSPLIEVYHNLRGDKKLKICAELLSELPLSKIEYLRSVMVMEIEKRKERYAKN